MVKASLYSCFYSESSLIYLLATSSLQFETDYVIETELIMSDELLNTKYKDKLEKSYKVMFLCFPLVNLMFESCFPNRFGCFGF